MGSYAPVVHVPSDGDRSFPCEYIVEQKVSLSDKKKPLRSDSGSFDGSFVEGSSSKRPDSYFEITVVWMNFDRSPHKWGDFRHRTPGSSLDDLMKGT